MPDQGFVKFASGGGDGYIKAWQWGKKKPLFMIDANGERPNNPQNPINAGKVRDLKVAGSPHRILSAVRDEEGSKFKVYDFHSQKKIYDYKLSATSYGVGTISDTIAIVPADKPYYYLFTVYGAEIIDLFRHKVTHSLYAHKGGVSILATTPDQRYVLTGSLQTRYVYVWDWRREAKITYFTHPAKNKYKKTGPDYGIEDIEMLAGHKMVALSWTGGYVQMIDTNDWSVKKTLSVRSYPSTAHIEFIEEKDVLLLGTIGGEVYLWKFGQDNLSKVHELEDDGIWAMDANKNSLILGTKRGKIHAFSIQ